ncbi:uncharacterized protein LOC116201436 [Punica granatum]|uniref:Uncharacterized protein LOC116201436 n=2 Tax=Punica granatum TaxID=22663 RepID=A0A6P8CUX8_PUNGR|nr:uncharacterized protein LOC116201436 [Punica granatum]XP_031388538.1 uncharacterized protein LOC116201436 [Punica granatum]OWM77115.1 hypothetical protein CDL15_Pgr013206 [Punica granatum]PKI62313.1 hypothetical protein CRG98_017314 [Punica granatum]
MNSLRFGGNSKAKYVSANAVRETGRAHGRQWGKGQFIYSIKHQQLQPRGRQNKSVGCRLCDKGLTVRSTDASSLKDIRAPGGGGLGRAAGKASETIVIEDDDWVNGDPSAPSTKRAGGDVQ